MKRIAMILITLAALTTNQANANKLNDQEAMMTALESRITEFQRYMRTLNDSQQNALVRRAYLKQRDCFDKRSSSNERWMVFCTFLGIALTCVQDAVAKQIAPSPRRATGSTGPSRNDDSDPDRGELHRPQAWVPDMKTDALMFILLFGAAFMAGWYCPLPKRKKK